MANQQNLKPFKPGQSGNPSGRPRGIPNRKTIIDYLLFEADLEGLNIIKNKPSWWDNVKPKNLYEAMAMAMAIKAMSGDIQAFNALNRVLNDMSHGPEIDPKGVVHIYRPEKVESIEELNRLGDALREKSEREVKEYAVNTGMA